mmetsp:Transcript_2022/g.5791  ORF Transcript_2022/g.5791 Transcript_2022/m.5791 type:complete len:218 (+) Transcript_2022:2197-2850(+)
MLCVGEDTHVRSQGIVKLAVNRKRAPPAPAAPSLSSSASAVLALRGYLLPMKVGSAKRRCPRPPRSAPSLSRWNVSCTWITASAPGARRPMRILSASPATFSRRHADFWFVRAVSYSWRAASFSITRPCTVLPWKSAVKPHTVALGNTGKQYVTSSVFDDELTNVWARVACAATSTTLTSTMNLRSGRSTSSSSSPVPERLAPPDVAPLKAAIRSCS